MTVTYNGGKKWKTSDELTGSNGLTNLNAASNQGIVSSTDALGLFIEVEAIKYVDNAAVTKTYNGTLGTPVAIAANQASVFVWIDSSNALQQSIVSFPSIGNFFVALAVVTTSVTNVILIVNMAQISRVVNAPGVQSVSVTPPVLDTGTASDPVIDMQPATAAQDGHATAAQITKLDAIETAADVTDAANVASAGAIMDADITANGNLITKAAGVIAEIVPGLAGTILTSAGVGIPPVFAGSTGFSPQVLIANSSIGIAGGTPLPYDAVEWNNLFTIGSIIINAVNPEIIDIIDAGLYIAIASIHRRGTNIIHSLQFNSPVNPATKRGDLYWNEGSSAFTEGASCIIGGFIGPGQLALETTGTNFGTNGVDGIDPFRNMLAVFKVSN